jgi:hypothetical protein
VRRKGIHLGSHFRHAAIYARHPIPVLDLIRKRARDLLDLDIQWGDPLTVAQVTFPSGHRFQVAPFTRHTVKRPSKML